MKLRQVLNILIVIVAVIIIYLASPSIKSLLKDWKLLPEPEQLTELYFTHPNSLPATYSPGQVQAVAFTVHNLEYKTTSYHYFITEQSQTSGQPVTLSRGSFTLAQNGYKSPVVNISLPDAGARAKVTVNLVSENESINYWVNRAAL